MDLFGLFILALMSDRHDICNELFEINSQKFNDCKKAIEEYNEMKKKYQELIENLGEDERLILKKYIAKSTIDAETINNIIKKIDKIASENNIHDIEPF